MDLSRPRDRWIALWALALFLVAWDIWAIALDQRLKLPDTFVMHTLGLRQALDGDGLWIWLSNLGPKGPLCPVLALPLLLIFNKAPFAMSLVTALAHGALVLQTYDLARLVSRRTDAGLWAALLLGTCPFIFGISRLAYHDFLIGNFVVAAMQIMLRVRLERYLPMAALGLVLGLGLLVKHSFPLYMAGPGLWFLARRVRRPRHLLHLAVMGLPMVAVASAWALPNGRAVLENLFANTSLPDVPVSAEMGFYLGLPGAAPLFAVAMISALAVGVSRRVSLWDILLMFTFVPMFWGLHQVTGAARYLIPMVPLWATLAGAGLVMLQDRLPGRAAAGLSWAGAAGLLGLFVTLNFTGIDTAPGIPREDFGGIIRPETRPHDGFARAMAALNRHGPEAFVIYDSVMSYCEKIGQEVLWDFQGVQILPLMEDDVEARFRRGEGVSVLFIRQFPKRPLTAPPAPDLWPPVAPGEHHSLAMLARRVSWLARRKDRKLVISARDPDGVLFEGYRLGPPANREERTGK